MLYGCGCGEVYCVTAWYSPTRVLCCRRERERPPVCCLKSFFIGFGPLYRLRSNWRSRLQSLLQFALVPGWRGGIPPPVC